MRSIHNFFSTQSLLLVSCLFLLLSATTDAWVRPQHATQHRMVFQRNSVEALRLSVDDNDTNEHTVPSSPSSSICERRAFLTWMATSAGSASVLLSATTTPPPAHALPVMSMPNMPSAAVTELEADLQAFQKSLEDFQFNPSKWPESPSPLPTRVQSAQELTAPDLNRTLLPQMPQSVLGPNELEQAIQESIRKRRVDPLTHG